MIVRTLDELNYVFSCLEQAKRYGLDTETVDRGYPDIKLVGVSLAWSRNDVVYIPVGHKEGAQLPQELVLERLKKFIEGNPQKIAVMHNAKYDMTVLDLLGGIQFSPNIFDTMVAAWLLDTENPHGLKALVKRYLNYAMTELDSITPKEKHPVTGDTVYRTDLVPIETLGTYAADDARQTLALMDLFLPRLEADGQMKVFCELEMPKIFVLKDIEMNGILVDEDALRRHLSEAPARLAELEQRMYSLRPNGQPFNANSPKQLNQILFHELGIKPSGEHGKSGLYSTDKDKMALWANEHPLVEAILEYRNLSKLLGTYLEGLTKRLGPDGRIHTRFNQILTTGRLSSSNPNLQNIPKPDKDTFGLRDLFIAGEGKKLVVADYSQIELRVLAHISKDPTFIKAFVDDVDLHSFAAKVLFDLPEPLSEVKEKHKVERSIGKCVTCDTRIATRNGLVRIDSLSDFREPDKFVKLELHVLTKDGEKTTSYFYYGGKQKIFRIETKQGFKIAGTPNHKVLVRSGSEDEWKRLDELAIGDKLVIKLGGNSPEKYVKVNGPLWSDNDSTEESLYVAELDESLGRLLGYVIGFSEVGGQEVSVPECIYRSPHSVVKEFVSALFETLGDVILDGEGRLAMSTKEKSFAQEIQLLLSWLGVLAVVDERPGGSDGQLCYAVCIPKGFWRTFRERVGFVSRQKQKELNELCEKDENAMIDYAEISMIEEDEDEVFDFEVPEVHNFVGNGLVQHNTFNFAMVYGAGVKRLAAAAKVDEKKAKELRDRYMAMFSGIERYISAMQAKAEEDGYVSTIIGRRRHLKDAQLRGRTEQERAAKAAALRQASNSPVQGSAADILFIAMRNIRNRLIKEGLTDKIKMVLQVHDELLFEVDERIAEYAAELVKHEMETAVKLRVPLIADTEIGMRWSDCK
jgi:DNA polymerase I-like protein with 3'-5' exonuclease and polymerase domains